MVNSWNFNTEKAEVFIPQSADEIAYYSTVLLRTESGQGTGFFYNMRLRGSNYIPLLITNKHVVENAQSITIRMHSCTRLTDTYPSGNIITFTLKAHDQHSSFYYHLSDEVDLCALPLVYFKKIAAQHGYKPYYRVINEHGFARETHIQNMRVGEEVIMIGYPIGLSDVKNNYPLLRRGNLATSPLINYNGRKEFVIDASCFPGSSGSPIFYKQSKNTLLFLGVLYGGPVLYQRSQIIGYDGIYAENKDGLPINLGYALKAERVRELIEQIRSDILNGHIQIPQ